ncbi:sodium:solute symporter family transporter, partial [Aminipila sp.]
GSTLLIGIIVFIFTIYPPDLIVWINLFAMGGLECAFFCPILFGLYWRRANATGAVLSALCGVTSFILMNTLGISIAGTTPIVPSIIISIAAFVVGSFVGPQTDEGTLTLFFGEKQKGG